MKKEIVSCYTCVNYSPKKACPLQCFVTNGECYIENKEVTK